MLNKNTSVPLYKQISNILELQIKKEIYKPLTKFPTEVELIKKFKVSRVTIRKAIQDLIKKGLVETEQGKGTFVKKKSFYYSLDNLKSFYEVLVQGGIEPETELVKFGSVKAIEQIKNHLEISNNEKVIRILRLYYVDGIPIGLSQISLHPRFSGIVTEEEVRNHPAMEILVKKSDYKIGKAYIDVFAEGANQMVQKLLGIPKDYPILGIERILYSTNNEPLEHLFLWLLSDKYRFSLNLEGSDINELKNPNQFKLKQYKDRS